MANAGTANVRKSKRPRKNRVSVAEVASRAGVCAATVSRVVNGQSQVNADLRRRVWDAGRQLGFVPNPNRCIVAIIAPLRTLTPMAYGSALMTLLARQMTLAGYGIRLVDPDDLDGARDLNVRGAVITSSEADEGIASLGRIPNYPVISLNNSWQKPGVQSVCTDHRQQGRLAGEHLLARGHRRIGFIAHSRPHWGDVDRWRGFSEALSQAGVTPNPDLAGYTRERPLYNLLQKQVEAGVTAVVNFSEYDAVEGVHLLQAVLGKRIPTDISTICMESYPVFEHLQPAQTVIRQPLEKLTEVAVDRFGRYLAGEAEPSRDHPIYLPVELVARESVAKLTGAGAQTNHT